MCSRPCQKEEGIRTYLQSREDEEGRKKRGGRRKSERALLLLPLPWRSRLFFFFPFFRGKSYSEDPLRRGGKYRGGKGNRTRRWVTEWWVRGKTWKRVGPCQLTNGKRVRGSGQNGKKINSLLPLFYLFFFLVAFLCGACRLVTHNANIILVGPCVACISSPFSWPTWPHGTHLL